MTKFLLIASVAAMAVTAPAQAERGGHKGNEAEAAAQPGGNGGQKAERAQAPAPARPEARAQARPQQIERAQQRSFEPRVQVRQQAVERRSRALEMRAARPQAERRARTLETRTIERARTRAVAQERVEQKHALRAHAIEQRQRVRTERMTTRSLRQEQKQEQKLLSRELKQDRRAERFTALRDRAAQPTIEQQPLSIQQPTSWQSFASRVDRREALRRDRREGLRMASIGAQVNPDWYDSYVPVRTASYYDAGPDYYYRYDDDNGYLYRIRDGSNLVSALFPILGGAYSVGRPLPYYTDSFYNVPYGYSSLYYDTPDMYYRYGDGAIYGVDPMTQLITGIVALLTGQSLGVGQMLPAGYDVYNVPYAYRSTYYDTPDMWYRYDDGYIYGVDPYTRMIEASYPVYGGYYAGSPWPSYAGYDYGVPDYYDDLYYDEPGYDYRYASGGIYQVEPKTQLIAALAALVTGQNFNVGQRLPLGYDVYNVPFAYRDRYYDNDEYLYRYADGRILQVDPDSMLIRRVILV